MELYRECMSSVFWWLNQAIKMVFRYSLEKNIQNHVFNPTLNWVPEYHQIKLLHELLPIFPTEFNGHGFLMRDYIRHYTELQEGPLCPPTMAPW